MSLLIFAVVLAVMQTSPPVPWKTANNQTSQSTKNHYKANGNQKAVAPVQPVSRSNPAPQENSELNPAGPSNAQITIRVPELPTVTVRTDGWMIAYVICTGLLVVVGGFGVCYAIKTLKAIKRQADLMEGGLYIDIPNVIEFEDGRRPIFFVNIMNSGMIATRNVSISIKIELGDHTTEYIHDQVMTIPAHGGRECFLRHGIALKTGELLKIQRGELALRISGHAANQKEKIEYCYKYSPWPFGERPTDLPTFVACDFDTQTAVSGIARPAGVLLKMTTGKATASAENPSPETPKGTTESI